MADKQIPLLLLQDRLVYRAYQKLLEEGRVVAEDFKLRPLRRAADGSWQATEDGLSVALTCEKAMEIKCRGCVSLRVGDIQKIEGLSLIQKDPNDPDYWEIIGIPKDNFTAVQDLAIALAKCAGDPEPHPERWKR